MQAVLACALLLVVVSHVYSSAIMGSDQEARKVNARSPRSVSIKENALRSLIQELKELRAKQATRESDDEDQDDDEDSDHDDKKTSLKESDDEDQDDDEDSDHDDKKTSLKVIEQATSKADTVESCMAEWNDYIENCKKSGKDGSEKQTSYTAAVEDLKNIANLYDRCGTILTNASKRQALLDHLRRLSAPWKK